MAGSLNKVILVGHLGQDPKISYTQSGQPVANLRMATSERFKDKSGQWTDRTEWHTVVAWGKDAEFCSNYLAKGALVMIEGRLQTRKWQDKEGQDRYSTEVVANRVQSLGGRPQGEGAGASGMRPQGGMQPQNGRPAQQPQRGGGNQPFQDDEDLGPAFPSEASGMDDVPF
ncbi:single-stranded DNA-binding protein [Humidesulfovibrio idahonensis]